MAHFAVFQCDWSSAHVMSVNSCYDNVVFVSIVLFFFEGGGGGEHSVQNNIKNFLVSLWCKLYSVDMIRILPFSQF